MKLTIDSTNIALWIEGQLTSFSKHTLQQFEQGDNGYHDYMTSIEQSPAALFKAIFSDDFPFDDQIKLLSILNVHALTFSRILQVHPGWRKTLRAAKGVLGMRRFVPGEFEFEHFGIHPQREPRTIELPCDPYEYVKMNEANNILAMVVGTAFYIDENKSTLPNEFTQYELLGRMAYQYAATARDLIDWNAACILTSIATEGSDSLDSALDLLHIIREMASQTE